MKLWSKLIIWWRKYNGLCLICGKELDNHPLDCYWCQVNFWNCHFCNKRLGWWKFYGGIK